MLVFYDPGILLVKTNFQANIMNLEVGSQPKLIRVKKTGIHELCVWPDFNWVAKTNGICDQGE